MELINLKNMNITDINESNKDLLNNIVLTIGIFDGVHLAHKKIIETMNTCKYNSCSCSRLYSAVMTFDPHPDYVLNKRHDEGYITPISKKIEIFKDLDVDYLIVIHFNSDIANIEYEDFYNRYLSEFAYFVIGYDFRFGAKAKGTAEYLKSKKDKTIIVSEIEIDKHIKLSSTLVRDLLEEGNVRKVSEVLGKPFEIDGTVSTGAHIGASLGFPTANIALGESYASIKNGVYFVKVYYKDNEYYGICNIGHNPSINYVKNKRLEVNLFDFNLSIYGENIKVEFIDFIRVEKKFDSKEELIKQINLDKEKAKELILLLNK